MSLLPLANRPGPLPAPAAPATATAPTRSPALGPLLPALLSLLPLLVIGVWAALDWRTVHDGTTRLAAADPWWLLSAVVFTCLGWVATSCARQGALPDRLPPGLLLASQIAAGAANHVLPASVGAHAVTVRFLQRRGIPLTRAAASLALYSLVKPVTKTLLFLAFLVALPDLLHLGQLVPDQRTLLLAALAVLIGLAATALLLATVRPLRRPVLTFLDTALTDARLLHSRPSRVLALWGGAAAIPLLQASVIYCVGASLGLPLSWTQVTFAFLAASTAVGAVPTPGGIGPVDAALVFTMNSLGAPLGTATATVIGYRIVTIWLPLLPGALLLSALVHRKVL